MGADSSIRPDNNAQIHSNTKKPETTPKMNLMVCLYPSNIPNDAQAILLGPGVNEVITINDKKAVMFTSIVVDLRVQLFYGSINYPTEIINEMS